MSHLERFYPESRFGGFTDVDGTITFYLRINALLRPEFTVVDFGCGRGIYDRDLIPLRRDLRILRGKVRRVIGLDVDEAAAANPHLDEFRLLREDAWPIPDGSVDLIVSDGVVEHLERPERFFAEARRALVKGGYLCLRTMNARGYSALASRLIPNRYHARILKRVGDPRGEEDVFATLYRCNTISKVRRALDAEGFDHIVYGYEAEPSYLGLSRLTCWLGALHQRFAPGFLRQAIFAFGRLRED